MVGVWAEQTHHVPQVGLLFAHSLIYRRPLDLLDYFSTKTVCPWDQTLPNAACEGLSPVTITYYNEPLYLWNVPVWCVIVGIPHLFQSNYGADIKLSDNLITKINDVSEILLRYF